MRHSEFHLKLFFSAKIVCAHLKLNVTRPIQLSDEIPFIVTKQKKKNRRKISEWERGWDKEKSLAEKCEWKRKL